MNMSTITHDRIAPARPVFARKAVPAAMEEANILPSARRLNAGLAALRVIVGSVFLVHGAQKLFVFGLAGVTGAFDGMGVPLAGVAAPAVAFIEFFGGLALVLGLFARVVSLGLAGVMLGAIFFVHLAGGFFAPEGVEFVLTLFAAAVAFAIAGPGGYSLDALLARRRAAVMAAA